MFSAEHDEQEATEPDEINGATRSATFSDFLSQDAPLQSPFLQNTVDPRALQLETTANKRSRITLSPLFQGEFVFSTPGATGNDSAETYGLGQQTEGRYLHNCNALSETMSDRSPAYFSHDISRGFEKVHVSCVNHVDKEPFPEDSFLYTPNRLVSHRAASHMDYTTCRNCDCKDQVCGSGGCVGCGCGQSSSSKFSFSYDSKGHLKVASNQRSADSQAFMGHWLDSYFEDTWMSECSFKCRCGMDCPNRVVQGGLKHRLQVFRTTSGGWGVKTLNRIEQGEFVIEYGGELLTVREAEDRIEVGDAKIEFTFFLWRKLKGGKFSSRSVLDSTKYGNVSRFIRHSSDPNLVLVKVVYDDAEVDLFHVAFFAARDIEAGEELFLFTGHTEPKSLPNSASFDPTPHGLQNVSKSKLSDTIRKHSYVSESTDSHNHLQTQDVAESSRPHSEQSFFTSTTQDIAQGVYASRDHFFAELTEFLGKKDKVLKTTRIGGKQVDLFIFYHEVVARGGLQEVISSRRWREISKALAIPVTATSAASELRRNYANYLYEFEQWMVFGNPNPPEISCNKHYSKDYNHNHGQNQGQHNGFVQYHMVFGPTDTE